MSGYLKFALTTFLLFANFEVSASELEIVDAWSRAPITISSNIAVYLTIINHGTENRLIAAQSDLAERATLHEHAMDGGIMRMREVGDGIYIPPDTVVKLEPGGYHVMLMHLVHPVQAGDKFPLKLTFERGFQQEIDVEVRNAVGENGFPYRSLKLPATDILPFPEENEH